MDTETRYRVLKLIEEKPYLTQRALAEHLGVSVGKVNYCVSALVQKGFIKARNFKNSRRKLQYVYVLTPQGVQERSRVTLEFLKRKAAEFDEIREELDRLSEHLPEPKPS